MPPPPRPTPFPYTTLFRSPPALPPRRAPRAPPALPARRAPRAPPALPARRAPAAPPARAAAGRLRSEEHTSELQSRRELVCRLLLEKKKESASRLTARATP